MAAGVSLILVLISGYWQFLPGWTQEAANGSFFFFYRRFSVPLYPLWVGLTLAILIGSLRSRRSPQIVLALVVLNGWIFGMFFNPIVSAWNTVDVTPPAVEVLKHYPHQRVAGIGTGTLQPNYSMRWSLRDVRGYEPLVVNRVPDLYRHLTGGSFEAHQFISQLDESKVRLLKRLGCSLVISPARHGLADLELIRGQFPFLYRIKGAKRVSWAQSVQRSIRPPRP